MTVLPAAKKAGPSQNALFRYWEVGAPCRIARTPQRLKPEAVGRDLINQSINWRASFIRSAPADPMKNHYGDSPELHPSHTLWGTLIELGWFPLIWCYFRNFVLLIFPGVVLVTWEDWTGPGDQTLRVVTCWSQWKSSHSEKKKRREKKNCDSKSTWP